jgi:hypothetical protein
MVLVGGVPQGHTENMGWEVFGIFPGLVSWKLRGFVKGLGPTSGIWYYLSSPY